jgi:hypothetical protein
MKPFMLLHIHKKLDKPTTLILTAKTPLPVKLGAVIGSARTESEEILQTRENMAQGVDKW